MDWSDVLNVLAGIARLIYVVIHWRFWVCLAVGGGLAALLCWLLPDDASDLGATILCLGIGAVVGFVWDCVKLASSTNCWTWSRRLAIGVSPSR